MADIIWNTRVDLQSTESTNKDKLSRRAFIRDMSLAAAGTVAGGLASEGWGSASAQQEPTAQECEAIIAQCARAAFAEC